MLTLSVRRVAAGAALAGLVLMAAGGVFGYWLAALAGPPAPPAPPAPLASATTPAEPRAAAGAAPATGAAPAHPFTLEQIGILSARLFRLESEAAQLGQRLGLLPAAAAAASAARNAPLRAAPGRPDADPAPGGRGGPLLQPRTVQPPASTPGAGLGDLSAIDAQVERLEEQLGLVSDAAALRRAALMRLPSVLPVRDARQVSSFGNRSDPLTERLAFHAGVDFAASHGAPILAAAGGRVDVAGYRPDFGWTVEIAHGNGLRTRYAHASTLLVRRGAIVAPGERIALVGSSGRSTGPHLHFEVLREGAAVDPHRYLAQR